MVKVRQVLIVTVCDLGGCLWWGKVMARKREEEEEEDKMKKKGEGRR